MIFTESDILKMSPDAASSKAAMGLLTPSKWGNIGQNDIAVWGECQGSGSKPYQVRVDKSGPAFKCSCPSRKFPCKHGLAMMVLLARMPDKFSTGEPPSWVSEWLGERQKREEKKEQKEQAKAEAAQDPKNEEAAKKREAKRWERMLNGLSDLETWMNDHARQGFSHIPNNAEAWRNMTASMVDAQLAPISNRLKRLWDIVGTGDWHLPVGRTFASLALLVEAARNIDRLPENLAAEVRAILGIAPEKAEILAEGETATSSWLIAGQTFEEIDKLWIRKVWLVCTGTGKKAMLLDFSYGNRKFDQNFVTGDIRQMTLAFFPGADLLRAIVKSDDGTFSGKTATGGTLDETLTEIATRLAKNPWAETHPVFISKATPFFSDGKLFVDCNERHFPTSLSNEKSWRLVAASGGKPLTVFGEWDGYSFKPLNAWDDTRIVWAGDEL